ncbi:MAG: 30S ribosomal protein S20 [Bdellovibrionales bacterium]|nr:30S ribosomal protein S20 [Bdellovibrionales bacterium]
MANHKSAKKRIRQNNKLRAKNRTVRSSVRTAIKKVRALVAEGKLDKAKEGLQEAEQSIQKAARRGLYHQKNADRKVSRLTKLVQGSPSTPAA